jgi:hypothetical protein
VADSYEIGTGHVTIETKFDGRRVRRMSFREGHAAGTSFYHGFRRGSLYRFNKLWKVFFKPLNNLKKWLTRFRMPALFAGLAGSVLTLVPTLTQLGSVVGVGMIPAFLSWFSTIGLIRGILGKLQSDIKGQTLKALNDAAAEFKELAREAAKPGLNAVLEEAIKHAPILNKYIKELGGHLSDVGFAMRDVLRDATNIHRIKTTLNDTAEATGIWYSLLDEAAEVLVALASSGAPLFLRFTRSMERVALTIHDWIMLKKATGELDRYLTHSYLTLEKFGRGGRDFLIGLFNIINGGVFGTEKVADSFERWGASFRKWSEDADNVAKVRDVISWFTDHVGEFFRFAAAATAVQLALTQISKIKSMALFVRTLIGLGPAGLALFGIGAALSSLMGGFVLAYTHSERFRKKLHALVGEVAGRLAPIFKDWWNWAKANLVPLLEELAIRGIEELGKSIHHLLDVVDDNKEGLKAWRPVILFLIKAISYLTGFAIKGLIEELEGLITMVGWVGRGIGALERLFDNLPGWIGTAVDAVSRYFSRLRDRAGEVVHNTAAEFRALPGKITGFLKSLPGALVRSLEAAMEGAALAVGYGIGAIVNFFVRLPGRVITIMDAFWDELYAQTKRDIGKIVDFFALLPGRIMRWFDRTWDGAYETTVEWFDKIRDFVGKLPGRVLTALVNLPEKIRERFSNTWTGAQKESSTKVSGIMTWITKIPGRAWAALVKLKDRLVDRFAEGWSKATGTSKDKVKAIINFILGIPGRAFNALRALAGQLKSRASTGWQAFRDELGRKVASTITYVSQIPGRIKNGLGNMASLLKQKGKDTFQGFLDGLKSVWEKIKSWILGIPAWIREHKGPLSFDRKLLIPAGKAIMEGLGTGLFFGSKGPFGFLSGVAGNIKSLLSTNIMALLGDLGGGGGGSAGGLVGFARLAWQVLSKTFGLPMGGWRAHGSVPGSDHPKGKAIDIMTGNPLLHRLIIELGKRLPGAKYWISMRQIALAREGWKARPYHGPNPHTDHVHWSFFRQGRHGSGLPEDVYGLGRSGRGYVMHKGEQVLRQGETKIGHQGAVNHYHFQPGSVVLDASSVKDLRDIVGLIQGLQSTVRQHGVTGTARVA